MMGGHEEWDPFGTGSDWQALVPGPCLNLILGVTRDSIR